MAKPVLEWVVARDDRGTAAAAGVGRRAVATVAELGVGVVRERTPPVIEEVGGDSSIDRGGGGGGMAGVLPRPQVGGRRCQRGRCAGRRRDRRKEEERTPACGQHSTRKKSSKPVAR
jgi:hypothetical protein